MNEYLVHFWVISAKKYAGIKNKQMAFSQHWEEASGIILNI